MKTPKIVGAKYRVIETDGFFKKDSEVTLVCDDATRNPWFSRPIVDGNSNWFTPNGPAKEGDPGAVLCAPCWMGNLELIETPKDLAAENEALRKEVAELKARLTRLKPPKVGDKVRLHFDADAVVEHIYNDGRIKVVSYGETASVWSDRLTVLE